MRRELKTRPINECRCDERLKTKADESTRLTYTGLLGELKHQKIKTVDRREDKGTGDYTSGGGEARRQAIAQQATERASARSASQNNPSYFGQTACSRGTGWSPYLSFL
jgi:hypothetical protein